MRSSRVIAAPLLLMIAGLVLWRAGAIAQPLNAEHSSAAHQVSEADDKAIRDILKDHERAWNAHDMTAFTKSFREDADGINVVGMYWRGKAAVQKHLAEYHATIFKDLEETIDEVTAIHSIDSTHAVAVSIWKVGSFKAPSGAEVPACRHRNTLVLAKGTQGWQVVHFHNTIIDEEAAKAAAAPPKR